MDEGTLERSDGGARLRFTRRLAHPPSAVWRALTEPDDLAAWFPTTIEGGWEPAAPLRFSFRDDEAPPFDGEVVAYQPHRRLEYRWGEDTLRFDLEPHGDGTVLHLTDVLGTLGKAARDAAGWHVCLDLLGHRLDREPPGWTSDERWPQVHPGYVERFGSDAATLGPGDW